MIHICVSVSQEYLTRLRQIRLQNFNERQQIKARLRGEKVHTPTYIHTFTLFDHFSTLDLLLTILSVVSLFGCLTFLIPILMFHIIYSHQFQCFYTLLNIFRFCLFSIFLKFLDHLSQYDSDSDSLESCEEAVLRRKKIEALKVIF